MGKLHGCVGFKAQKYKVLTIYLQLMEIAERREPLVIYQVPLLAELEIKSLIINALPQAQLTAQHITLRKKEGKYQVFLMVPSSKVQQICSLKQITINKENFCIKRSFTEAQVFISRIPETITIEDILGFLEAEFGKVVKYHEGQPHQQTKSKLRHCYIQFEKDEDAEKCLFSYKKLKVKDSFQLRPSRAYGMSENDETDKKLFLKIVSPIDDQEDAERTINVLYVKEGKLREKIRVENGKATIIYTSAEVADRVLHNFKGGKIGKYDVVLRPHAGKDSCIVFIAGLKATVTQQQLEETFKHYTPIVSCTVQSFGYNSPTKSGTITFGSQEAYKRLLVEYKQDPLIKKVFANVPYITQHMSSKDRNDYNSFRKGKDVKKPIIPPGFPIYAPMPAQINFTPQMRPPMGNFGGLYQPMP